MIWNENRRIGFQFEFNYILTDTFVVLGVWLIATARDYNINLI